MKIRELKIYSSKLKAQKVFYVKTLGLPLLQETEDSFTVAIGKSKLIFQTKENTTPYHYAINIPSNQAMDALSWLQERVEIQKYGDNELVDFINWNATSVYFYDAEQNIVELIARKNLHIQSIDTFDYHAFLSISEVGVPVIDIKKCYEDICRISDMPVYDGDLERFCAVGDEKGLFILVNKDLKNWFPTDDVAYSSDFVIRAENRGEEFSLSFQQGKLKRVAI
ncbi:VOC family protein [Sunxiuqinia sp. A32]|uniref:VOC family protein n=1 Tax=Sunxiuqinia sp. A32 TaxID=3461496 RepID=UPI00404676E8